MGNGGKGRLIAILTERACRVVVHTVSPRENHHRQFPSFRTQASLESRFRPLLFGGGGAPRGTTGRPGVGETAGRVGAAAPSHRPRLAGRQAPTSGRSLGERGRSVPGSSAGHVVRAPRLGGGREEGGHVLGWGEGPHLATRPVNCGLAWSATGDLEGARRRELCASPEGGQAFVARPLPSEQWAPDASRLDPRCSAQLRARRCLPQWARGLALSTHVEAAWWAVP